MMPNIQPLSPAQQHVATNGFVCNHFFDDMRYFAIVTVHLVHPVDCSISIGSCSN